jgi:hypothetical protein
MKSLLSLLCVLVAVMLITGCKKKEEVAEVEAAKALGEAAKALGAMSGQGAEGSAEAAKGVGDVGKALAEATKALAGAGAKPQGNVVNWRKLAPLLPDKLGDYAADGEVKGSTNTMGSMKISEVKRRYKAGDKKLRVEISDAWLVPMLRTGFAMAQAVNQDSSEGIQKGVKINGQPAILKWRKARKRGRLTIMVGGRFMMKLSLRPSEDPDEVVKLAKGLDLSALAKLKAD